MGTVVSWLPDLWTGRDIKTQKAVERELQLVAQHTTWSVEELREMHAAFLDQYPGGYLTPQQFIDENTEAIGGPPELWQHYFNIIAHPPLIRRRQRGGGAGAGGGGGGGAIIKDQSNFLTSGSFQGLSAADGANSSQAALAALKQQIQNNQTVSSQQMKQQLRTLPGNGVGLGSISERLAAANRGDTDHLPGSNGNSKMKTSLVSTANLTEELDLDPHVYGLTFSHVMIRMHRTLYNPSEQKLKNLFNFFDVNQDGLISLSDLEMAFDWLFQVPLVQQTQAYRDLDQDQRNPKTRANSLLRLWDRDSDGLLNQDEFVEMGRADPDLLELLSALKK